MTMNRSLYIATIVLCVAMARDLFASDQAGTSNWVPSPHSSILKVGQCESGEELESNQPVSPEWVVKQGENDDVVIPRGDQVVLPDRDQEVLYRTGGRLAEWRWRDGLPLLVVLGLILLAAWVLKRFMPPRRLLNGSGVLDIVARASLSPKQSLVLVKVGRRLVLLGVSPERVDGLTVVDDPEQVSMLIGQVASRRPDSMTRSFASSFADQTRYYQEEAFEENATTSASDQIHKLMDKVRNMARRRNVA